MSTSFILSILIGCWLIAAAFMFVAWVVQQRTGNSGWVDVIWTIAVGTSGLTAIVSGAPDRDTARTIVVGAMIAIWMVRLAGHVALRSSRVSDDPRYERMREDWGDRAPKMMFWLLQLQALLAVPLFTAVALAAWHPAPLLMPLSILGLFVFAVAQIGSYVSDKQLTDFKRRKKAGTVKREVCSVGLWHYSRHPNYFFEWLIWCAFALLAIDLGGTWPLGLIAIAAPLTMFVLLRYVSGVPPLEAHMEDEYGEAYRDYQRRVSVFFPLPPSPPSKNDPKDPSNASGAHGSSGPAP